MQFRQNDAAPIVCATPCHVTRVVCHTGTPIGHAKKRTQHPVFLPSWRAYLRDDGEHFLRSALYHVQGPLHRQKTVRVFYLPGTAVEQQRGCAKMWELNGSLLCLGFPQVGFLFSGNVSG